MKHNLFFFFCIYFLTIAFQFKMLFYNLHKTVSIVYLYVTDR